MRLNFFIFLFSLLSVLDLCSCKKEHTTTSFDPFYKFKVNDNEKTINACGTTDLVAQYLKDTAVFAAFGCSGQRAGFYLKGKIADGSYVLDNNNTAWFDDGAASYETDSVNTGTLTMASDTFVLSNSGNIPIVKGTFAFDALNRKTGEKIKVTSGEFLLKKY